MRTTETLIRLCVCAGWFESSLDARGRRGVFTSCCSNNCAACLFSVFVLFCRIVKLAGHQEAQFQLDDENGVTVQMKWKYFVIHEQTYFKRWVTIFINYICSTRYTFSRNIVLFCSQLRKSNHLYQSLMAEAFRMWIYIIRERGSKWTRAWVNARSKFDVV